MTEASLTAKLMKSSLLPVGAIEVKYSRTNSMPFSAFADHQIHALLKVKKAKLQYKIQDVGVSKKPFDLFVMCHSPAWCCCIFKDCNYAYLIDIERFYKEMRTSKRRSLTAERASELAQLSIKI